VLAAVVTGRAAAAIGEQCAIAGQQRRGRAQQPRPEQHAEQQTRRERSKLRPRPAGRGIAPQRDHAGRSARRARAARRGQQPLGQRFGEHRIEGAAQPRAQRAVLCDTLRDSRVCRHGGLDGGARRLIELTIRIRHQSLIVELH
jgi:hypothetical protein